MGGASYPAKEQTQVLESDVPERAEKSRDYLGKDVEHGARFGRC